MSADDGISDDISAAEWEAVVAAVIELKAEYDALVNTSGVNVTFALAHINRDLTRYANGERTRELYDELRSKE